MDSFEQVEGRDLGLWARLEPGEAILDPVGGVIADEEARSAISSILALLREKNLLEE